MAEDSHKTIIREPALPKGSGNSTKREACLLVMAGATIGAVHKLPEKGEVVIGRASDADIRLNDDDISRRHARLTVAKNGDVTITDLGSTNGTYVNAAKILEQALHDGDKIQLG